MRSDQTPPMVSVILPTYNERENVAPLIRRLREAMRWPCELLVVDDSSPDGTAGEVRRLCADLPDLRLIVRDRERGLTRSIQRGIDESLGEIIVWMDCDLSMPPEKAADLVAMVLEGGADAAVGSRFVAGGSAESGERDPRLVRLQKALTRMMNRLISAIAGGDLHDWTSGFIAVRSPLAKAVCLRGEHGEYFIRLMFDLLRTGAKVEELPYRFVPRQNGESKSAAGPLDFIRKGVRYLAALASAA
jgi:glycosyltransferase involved in cell wall biosynthesis